MDRKKKNPEDRLHVIVCHLVEANLYYNMRKNIQINKLPKDIKKTFIILQTHID